MKKTVAIGRQSFEALREKDCFYIDKTDFIRQWWESEDDVTLIARPRRFGKTLNMDMLNCFFSAAYDVNVNTKMHTFYQINMYKFYDVCVLSSAAA